MNVPAMKINILVQSAIKEIGIKHITKWNGITQSRHIKWLVIAKNYVPEYVNQSINNYRNEYSFYKLMLYVVYS